MTEIMPHSENIMNLFYWMTPSAPFFFPLHPKVLHEEFRKPVEGDSFLSAAVVEVGVRSARNYKHLFVAPIRAVSYGK